MAGGHPQKFTVSQFDQKSYQPLSMYISFLKEKTVDSYICLVDSIYNFTFLCIFKKKLGPFKIIRHINDSMFFFPIGEV